MRRVMIIVLVIGLAVMSSGFAYSSIDIAEANMPEGMVHEYGTTQSIVDNSREFNSYILYPQIGIENIDKSIKNWVENVYRSCKTQLMGERRHNSSVYGELNIQYDIYLINDRYVGIVMKGSYSNSSMAEPTDFVKTFNIDLKSKVLLKNDDILSKWKTANLVALLRKKIVEYHPELKSELQLNRAWIMKLVLGHDSVDVILSKGDHLPTSYGTVTISLPINELGGAFLLTGYVKPKIDSSKPMVALTFDDGPSKYTEQILAILSKYDVHATFCVVGNRIETYGDTIVKVKESGSEIIGHSWDHKNLINLSEDQIRKQLEDTNDMLFEVAEVIPRFFRPPYGAMNTTIRTVAKEMNMIALMWSVDPEDWRTQDVDITYENIMNNVKDGSIILCHDLYEATVDAMERVIPALLEQGYQLVTVSELFEYCENIAK